MKKNVLIVKSSWRVARLFFDGFSQIVDSIKNTYSFVGISGPALWQ